MPSARFDNRVAFGVWINDFRNEPIVGEDWPSVKIDARTIEDFSGTIAGLAAARYTALDIFGLLTNRDWPSDIRSVVDRKRKAQVERCIDIAHAGGIRIIYGLGVYSWGFESIIKADPEVRGTNPLALCGSRVKSRSLMRQVIDFVSENFQVDGFHLEVADQGRCRCPECGREESVAYYSRLNRETAQYIRGRWPDKTLLVNTSGYLPWGDCIRADEYQHIYELGRHIDIFIDGGNHGLFVAENGRRDFIARLPCAYGTSGGFWVYPPQRWDRLRWFLPYISRDGAHLEQLYRDGGRSCELYLGPLANPGVELNVLCNGLKANDLSRPCADVLSEAVERLYKPKAPAGRSALVELFSQAEEAFFANWSPHRRPGVRPEHSDGIDDLFEWSKVAPERAIPGELFLEPLLGSEPGFPVYLAVHFEPEGRQRYKKELERIQNGLRSLSDEFDDAGRIGRVRACLQNTLVDIAQVQRACP
jgi:hypothetical protein